VVYIARKKIAEMEAEMILTKSDIAAADGRIQEARVTHQQDVDEIGDEAGAATPQSGHGPGPRN
jgi:hypothetical protein